jgi:hypothetical protein
VKTRIAIAVSILSMVAVTVAYGQKSSTVLGSVSVQFKFMAGKKLMPAGSYDIVRESSTDSLLLRGESVSTRLPILERLAETNPAEKHSPRVIFNTVGDSKVFSEFWPSGNSDGYLLATTKGAHTHEVVQDK